MVTSHDDGTMIQHRETFAMLDFEAGSVLLSPVAVESIKKATSGDILIETVNKFLVIKSGKTSLVKMAEIDKEYPAMKIETSILASITIEGNQLKTLEKVAYAAAQDETRPVLTAVYFEIEDNLLNLVSLDGFRVAISGIKIIKQGEDTPKKLGFLIGATKLQIAKILANAANVVINVTENYVFFITPQSVVAMRRLLGDYIAYKTIIPQEQSSSVTLNRSELLNSIERVSIFGDGAKNSLVKLSFLNNTLTVKATNAIGESSETLDCVDVKGTETELTLAFNCKFPIEALKNTFDSEKIKLSFGSAVEPVVIKTESGNDLAMMLPVRQN
jgi:DNA polymerase-3 subunit beta